MTELQQSVKDQENNIEEKVVFIYVFDQDTSNPIDKPSEETRFQFSCYAHYHIQSTLLIMGCKQSDAEEIAELVFKWVTEAKHNVKVEQLDFEDDRSDQEDSSDGNNSSGNNQTEEDLINNKKRLFKKDEVTSNNEVNNSLLEDNLTLNNNTNEGYDSGNDIDDSDTETPPVGTKSTTTQGSTSTSSLPIPQAIGNRLISKLTNGHHPISILSTSDQDNDLLLFGTSPSSSTNPKKRLLRYDKFIKNKSYLIREITYMLKQNTKLNIPQTLSKKNERNNVVFLTRMQFQEIIRIALNVYEYNRANRVRDFNIACCIQERKRPLIILFGGTSGTGKSTLASLIASRLGITKVLSTDNIRHMLRAFIPKDKEPVLFASTYHAGEALLGTEEGKLLASKLSAEELAVEGFRRQCKLVIDQLEKIIEQSIERNEALVVEGVHLLTDFIVELMKKHPNCILPYIIYISNQQKHKERFAIRAKYMTLEPRNNKYVKYFQNIRQIQKYLYDRADVFNVPKIDNTNIDRSIAAIHGSVFKSMKMVFEGKKLYNQETEKCCTIHPKSLFDKKHRHWSSKRMLQALQKRKSTEIHVNNTEGMNAVISSSISASSSLEKIVLEENKLHSRTYNETEDKVLDHTSAVVTAAVKKQLKTSVPVEAHEEEDETSSDEEKEKEQLIVDKFNTNPLRRRKGSKLVSNHVKIKEEEFIDDLKITTQPQVLKRKKKKPIPMKLEKQILEDTPQTPPMGCSIVDISTKRSINYYTTSEGVCSLSERDQDIELGQWMEIDTS
ncbi:hypothetical protein ABK040_016136 [Willaertia magna]